MSIEISTATRLLRLAAVIASLLVVAFILAGCSSSADMAASAGAAPVAEGDGGDSGDGSEPSDSSTANRSMIVTGSMYITVKDPLGAAGAAATIVTSAGGRVDARNETAPDEWNGGDAKLTLRIPADRLDAVVEDLRTLGTVDQFQTTASDVTNQVTDLDAHISTLRASTKRIEALLVDAKDISDIIKLEDELASRQAELESLEAQQRGLGDQVALSTIELSLTTVPVVIEDDSPSNFFTGLADGWNALVGFISGALVVLGVLLPWLILAGVITLAVLAAVRMGRSRSARPDAEEAEQVPDSVAPAEEATAP